MCPFENEIAPSLTDHCSGGKTVFERMLTLTHREHLQASGRLNEDGEMVKDEQNEADTEKPRKSKRTRGRKPAAAKTEDAKMDLDSLVYLPYFESMSEVFLEASSSEYVYIDSPPLALTLVPPLLSCVLNMSL